MAAYFTTESFSGREKISFRLLQARLIKTVNTRIQNGEFSERGLAKLLGISQPQIHNVLKGARKLNVELADRLFWGFGLTVLDLLDDQEIAEQYAARRLASPLPEMLGAGLNTMDVPRKQARQESQSRRSAIVAAR